MNLEDIAKLAGVSRSTVSRVINDDPNVSAKARARVQATIDEVGYRPHAAARALASHRSHAIGLVVPEDFSRYHVDNWYPLIIEATLNAARNAQQSLMLIMEDTFSRDAGQRLSSQFIDSGRVDGLLLLLHSYRDYLTPYLMDRNIPFALVAESNISGASWVDNDNYAGGKLAAEVLKGQGAQSVIVFAGIDEHIPSRRRIEGFLSVFPDAQVVYTDHSHERAGQVASPLLTSARPDAVFAVNGWIAPVLYEEAKALGLAIPDDMLLITHDEFDPDQNERLGLTAVVQQVSTLADMAVKLLIDRVEGRAPPGEKIVLDSFLTLRRSTTKAESSVVQGGATPS